MFQYRKRYGLHAMLQSPLLIGNPNVSIPQAVWIACNVCPKPTPKRSMFQYRKRYGLHAIEQCCWVTQSSTEFQYRKRYGLHAIWMRSRSAIIGGCVSIPQAVWIACNIALSRRWHATPWVSIPQAVWIACNTVSRKPWKQWAQKQSF